MTLNAYVVKRTNAIKKDVTVRVPKIRERVALSAANKASRKVGTQFRRALAQETGIKQKDFKGQSKLFRATQRRPVARTWFGTRRGIRLINVAKKPTGQFDKLARGSLHGRSGADAFKATVSTGNKSASSSQSTGFFVRKGKARLPISQVRIRFDGVAGPLLKKIGSAVGPVEFKKEFRRDLKRRLARR